MSGTTEQTDPGLLLEASRVFNAAGPSYQTVAEVLSDAAVAAVKSAKGRIQAAILCDAAALRLAGRLPGGWERALALLSQVPEGTSEDDGMREHLLRALAYGQQYKQLKQTAPPPERETILQNIRGSIVAAHQAYNTNTPKNTPWKPLNIRHYWDMTDPLRKSIPATSTDPEDDLREAANDDRELKTLLQKIQPTPTPI